MKTITPLSQNDSRWKYEKLGYGGTTIGSYGCLITALTCLARLDDVRKVNDVLKANNGYVGDNGNLVVWAACSKIPNLTFKYRYYSYDNNKVKEIIAKNGGCIIEVDGAPIGGYRHWLLFIGDGKLIDTWDGKIKSTNTYTPISFVDVEYKESEPMANELDVCMEDRKKFWKERDEARAEVEKLNDEIEELKRDLEQAIRDYRTNLEAKDDFYKSKLQTQEILHSNEIKTLEEDKQELSELLGESTSVNLELEWQLEQREAELSDCLTQNGQPTNLEDPILTKIADWIKKILGKLK